MATPASATNLLSHSNVVWSCAFSHDSSHVATVSADGTAKVWRLLPSDSAAGMVSGQLVASMEHHVGVVKGCGFSPDSALLATSSWDKSIGLLSCTDFTVSVSGVTDT